MTSTLHSKRQALLLCISCGAFAALTASMAAQSCANTEAYKSDCLAAGHTYYACSSGSECTIMVSKDPHNSGAASEDQPQVCVDTSIHPHINWDAADKGATITLTFDKKDPKGGSVNAVYKGTDSVRIPFDQSVSDCVQYRVKYCTTDGNCVKLDPKVIVNGGGRKGPP